MAKSDDSGQNDYQSVGIRQLWPELRPFRKLMLGSSFLVLLQSVFVFVPPMILGDIVNRLQRGQAVDTVRYLIYIVVFSLAQGFLGYALGVTISKL
jgi:hypothetical protein